MANWKVIIERTEYLRAEIEVEAENREEALDSISSDDFDCLSANEVVVICQKMENGEEEMPTPTCIVDASLVEPYSG